MLPANNPASAAAACPPPSAVTAPSTISDAERDAILQLHDQARSEVGSPPPLAPLTWDSSLADAAQGWANTIGPVGRLCHIGSGASGQGENLAAYTSGSVTTGVQGWYDEKPLYESNPEPINSSAPDGTNYHVWGHYTQMVWQNTQRIGCGKAPYARSPGSWTVLVCRYSPPGNVNGQFPY